MKNREHSITKAEILSDIKKRRLKVVLHRNKYFPTKSGNAKLSLIEQLLSNERDFLKLNESRVDGEVNKRIELLVEQRKAELHIDSDSENSLGSPPFEIMRAIKKNKRKEQQKQENVPFAVIPKHEMTKFISLLNSTVRANDYDRKLTHCLSHINTLCKPPWTSPSYILKAIHEAIQYRKWSNVTRLVLMFMNNFPVRRYATIFRYIFKLISKLNPVVQANGLEDKFTMISETYKLRFRIKPS